MVFLLNTSFSIQYRVLKLTGELQILMTGPRKPRSSKDQRYTLK